VADYTPALDSPYMFLAPYWGDLYPLGGDEGSLYYYIYTGGSFLHKATADVQRFSKQTSFKAEWMLVATWNNTKFPSNSDVSVTFFFLSN
jgi:hypothetical protein